MAKNRIRHFFRSPVAQAAQVTLATFLIAPYVHAQSDTNVTTTLPTVVISERASPPVADIAGVGDVPLARAPLSATVIDARQIEALGAKRLADLFQLDASVSDAYNTTGYWDYATVRGYVLDNKFNYRREGLPINAETFIALDNKERVELLKGTSGMQAGTSAPGGLVQYIVKRPTDAPLRHIQLETTSDGGSQLSADLGGRFGTDQQFGYRLNVAAQDIAAAIPHTGGSRQLAALALDWRLQRDTTLSVEIESSRRSQPSVPGQSLWGDKLPAPDPRLNINSQPWSLPVVLQGTTGSFKLEHALSADWKLLAQWGTQRLVSQDRAAFPFGCTAADGTWYADRYCPNGDFDLYDYRSENEHRTTDATQVQLRGQLATGSVKHQLSVNWTHSQVRDRFQGQAYNYVGTLNSGNWTTVAPDPSLTGEGIQRTERSDELAASDAIVWTRQLTSWLGARHTQLHRDSVRTDGSEATSYSQGMTTPWLALGYQLTEQHLLYASSGRGVESVVVPQRTDQYANAGQALAPVQSRQLEVGIKATDHDLSWQLTYFDIVRPATNIDACGAQFEVVCTGSYDGADRHRGIEAAAQWRRGPLALSASASVLKAQRSGSVANPEVNGKRPTNVPDNIVRLQADYKVAAITGLSLHGHWSREGGRWVLPDGSVTLPAWNRVDAAVRYATTVVGTPTTWSLAVDNLQDKRFFKESPYQFGHVYLFPGAARQFRLSVESSL